MAQSKPRFQGLHGKSVMGGYIDVVTVANPASGEDAVITVPAGEIWLVKTVHCTATDTSGGGSGELRLEIRDDESNTVFVSNEFTLSNNQSVEITWGKALNYNADGDYFTEALPFNMALGPGFTITVHADANTDITSVTMLTQEFVVG